MSDADESEDSGEYRLSLDTLPVEVFLCICSFLNAKILLNSLRVVCKRFNDILSDESYWRTWMKHRWPMLRVPALEISNEGKNVSLKSVCFHIDRELHLWSGNAQGAKKIVFADYHIAPVDAVKLLQNGELVVSGSRDRNIAIWNIKDDQSVEPLKHKTNAHEGWVWDISADGMNRFYTGSWDSTVKLWDMESQLVEVSNFKCLAAVLSVANRQDMIAAGLFLPRVQIFDARQGPSSVATYTPHKQAIMAVELCGDYIVSASEDRTIAVIDLRAGRVYKTGLYVNSNPKTFPRSLHYDHNIFYIGDNKGTLHVLNTANASFEVTESYDVGHTNVITSLWHGLGCIITGSRDKSVRILSPTSPPTLIADFSINSEVTSLDYVNSVLAIGCTENTVEVWIPSYGDD